MWLQWCILTCEGDYNCYWTRSRWNRQKAADRNNMQVISENCAPFIDCISWVKNPQRDNAKDLHIVIPMYILYNTVIITQKHQVVYSNIVKMNQMII